MTRQEFYTQFAEIAEKYKFEAGPSGVIWGLDVLQRVKCSVCPLTAVAVEQTRVRYDPWEWQAAAQQIGLSSADGEAIKRAADNEDDCDQRARNALLRRIPGAVMNPPESTMTRQEFYDEFEKIAREYNFEVRGDVGLIRGFSTTTPGHCPITAVCHSMTGKEYKPSEVYLAAWAIGLANEDREVIVNAADYSPACQADYGGVDLSCDMRVRNALLRRLP